MSTEFIRDEDRPYFKSGRPRYIEVESQATLSTADLIAEIERRIDECDEQLNREGYMLEQERDCLYYSKAELQSLLDWIKSKQLNTTK